jgi:TolB protein
LNAGNPRNVTWSPDGRVLALSSGAVITTFRPDGSYAARLTPLEVRYSGHPSYSPDGERIVFVSARDSDVAIDMMNADGSDTMRITIEPGDYGNPEWSPDGTRIAFDLDGQIHVMESDGSGIRMLTNGPDVNYSPTWSPQSDRIAFVSTRDDDREIYVMYADGSNQRRVTTLDMWVSSPSWSPSRAPVAFESHDARIGLAVVGETATGVAAILSDGADPVVIESVRSDNPSIRPTVSVPFTVAPGERRDLAFAFTPDAVGMEWANVTLTDEFGRRSVAQVSGVGRLPLPLGILETTEIAFVSDREGEKNVYLMRADGSNQVRLSPDGGTNPSWSPDGEKIAFYRTPTIFTIDRDGDNLFQVTADSSYAPTWSRDGSRIAYVSRSQIFVANPDGTDVIQLTDGDSSNLSPMWFPDSRRLAFTSDRGDGWETYVLDIDAPASVDPYPALDGFSEGEWSPDGARIAHQYQDGVYAMNADGSESTRIRAGVGQPSWSPDGESVAFTDYVDGNRDIYATRSDGTSVRRLTTDPGWDTDPAWSPVLPFMGLVVSELQLSVGVVDLGAKGSGVFTVTNVGTQGTTVTAVESDDVQFTVDVEPLPHVLPPNESLEIAVTFRPIRVGWERANVRISTSNGDKTVEAGVVGRTVPPTGDLTQTKIAFMARLGDDWDVYVINPDGSNLTRLTDAGQDDQSPAWTPDGRRIVYTRDRRLHSMDANGANKRSVTPPGTQGQSDPAVSPDGSTIAYTTRSPGAFRHLHLIDLDGANERAIPKALNYDFAPSWSPDGTKLVYYGYPEGSSHVYVVNIDGSDLAWLPIDGGSFPAWSPNGSKIAYPYGDGLIVVNADGSDPVKVTNNPRGVGNPSWSPDGTMIAFSSSRDGLETLYTANADGSNVRRLLAADMWSLSAAWSPFLTAAADNLRRFDYALPAGLSMFGLALEPRSLSNGTLSRNLDLNEPLRASDLIALGATVVIRHGDGVFRAAIGRDGGILYGEDFPLLRGDAYVINLLKAQQWTMTGDSLGAIRAAPNSARLGAFVLAGEFTKSPPPGSALEIVNERSGRVLTPTRMSGNRWIAAFVDATDPTLGRTGDGFRLVLRDARGYALRTESRTVGLADRARAWGDSRFAPSPAETRLLPNFPNPFNPETWIPFELTVGATVRITIYGARGDALRRMDLGYLPEGFYTTPSEAIHWDGRNERGERVSSGTYFVELVAGETREMRRLIVSK